MFFALIYQSLKLGVVLQDVKDIWDIDKIEKYWILNYFLKEILKSSSTVDVYFCLASKIWLGLNNHNNHMFNSVLSLIIVGCWIFSNEIYEIKIIWQSEFQQIYIEQDKIKRFR